MGSKKQLTTILAVVGAAVIGGLVYLYMLIGQAGDRWPRHREAGSLTSEVESLTREIQRLRTEVAKIPDAHAQLEAIKIEYELALRVLPKESSPDQLLAAIRTKAQQAGVVPDRVVPAVQRGQTGARRGAPTGAFEEWRFTVDIRGTYDQIASFVNRMEEFESSDATTAGSERRFFQVSDISITAEESGMALFPPNFVAVEANRGHKCTLIMQTFRFTGDDQAAAGARRR